MTPGIWHRKEAGSVCLIKAGSKFLQLPWDRACFQGQLTTTMLSATSGRAQTAHLTTLPWKCPATPPEPPFSSTGTPARMLSAEKKTQKKTEEPTNSDWNKKHIYHVTEQAGWKQEWFHNWSKSSRIALGPNSFHRSVLLTQTLVFFLSLFL